MTARGPDAACRAPRGQGTFAVARTLITPMYPRTLAALLTLCGAGLAGCNMQPEVAMSVTSADGQKLEVPYNAPQAVVTDGVVTVEQLQFAPWEMDANGKAKNLAFSFLLKFETPAQPAKIVIEDDTQLPILPLFEDDAPKLVRVNFWAALSKPFAPSDEHVNWVLDLDNNVRVYRLTVTLKDGSVHVLLKPVLVPAAMKAFIRNKLEMP